jgi:CRISPR-associated protein Cas2
MRRRYLFTYDVADDKRRDQIFQALKDNGDHTQYSVFLCELNDKEFIQLNSRLQAVVHDREDQILILDLGKEDGDITTKLRSLGKVYTPIVRAKVI